MDRAEFMKIAAQEIDAINNRRENRIIGLVERAWAEGKRNAEVESLRNAIDEALLKREGNDDAIPLEWIKWRIDHAEREGFPEAAKILKTVCDWWNDQKDCWQKEREEENDG